MKTTLLLFVLSCLLVVTPITAEHQLRAADDTQLEEAPKPFDALKIAIEKFKNKNEGKPESRRLTGERPKDKFVKAIAMLKEKNQARRVEEKRETN
ncbi:hypothetical protein P3T76_002116 [Phytophthora citrophthora]|uniref:RxLR effector protein n=1 Tax=Phytophthora citrophthora TaxID=4793 RepID=A0AAD9GYS7_9STRA|nr:hypothetical protein P3T76_002116 [Phytophthora citrophthora]